MAVRITENDDTIIMLKSYYGAIISIQFDSFINSGKNDSVFLDPPLPQYP